MNRDIRENFIRAKYELKAWIPRDSYTPHDVLNKQLCQTVKTDDVMATLELIVRGANVCVCLSTRCVYNPVENYHLCVLCCQYTCFIAMAFKFYGCVAYHFYCAFIFGR